MPQGGRAAAKPTPSRIWPPVSATAESRLASVHRVSANGIVVEGLVREFRKGPRAVDGIDLRVEPGEIYGFLGPNGAGKSTMIRLLLGFLHPSAGSASVLGLDIVRQSVEIRARSGYLPGGIALYDTMSGEDLLDYLGDLTGRPSTRPTPATKPSAGMVSTPGRGLVPTSAPSTCAASARPCAGATGRCSATPS